MSKPPRRLTKLNMEIAMLRQQLETANAEIERLKEGCQAFDGLCNERPRFPTPPFSGCEMDDQVKYILGQANVYGKNIAQ